jgi:AraC family ethanolamine operon transcriptional activator
VASTFTAGFVRDVQASSDLALEAATSGWDVHYAQLGPGRAHGRHVAVQTAGLQLCWEQWSVGMLKTGHAPRGCVTFVVPVGPPASARVQGRCALPGDVFVLDDGVRLDCRAAGPCEFASISVDHTTLAAHVRELHAWPPDRAGVAGRLQGLRTDAPVLRALCLELAGRAAAEPHLLREVALAGEIERRLVKLLCSGGEPGETRAGARGRVLALRADAWLRQSLPEVPTIAVLCEALGVRARTLHEAFRDHLDTTPKAYLKALRLNAARRDLLRAGPRTTVTEVALDWGFGHFGWFSRDYRRLFGEMPRETLCRGRAASRRAPAAAPRGDGAGCAA